MQTEIQLFFSKNVCLISRWMYGVMMFCHEQVLAAPKQGWYGATWILSRNLVCTVLHCNLRLGLFLVYSGGFWSCVVNFCGWFSFAVSLNWNVMKLMSAIRWDHLRSSPIALEKKEKPNNLMWAGVSDWWNENKVFCFMLVHMWSLHLVHGGIFCTANSYWHL